MSKDDLVHEIGTLLINDSDISSRPWKQLVMVAQLQEESTEVSGFAYYESGRAVPVSPDNFDIPGKFEQLRDSMREPGKDPWKAALVRINRESHDLSIDFEYEHPEKWLITPSNVKGMGESLRPVQS